MTNAVVEIEDQLVVVTILAAYDAQYSICMLRGHILLCQNMYLNPCFQPEGNFPTLKVRVGA